MEKEWKFYTGEIKKNKIIKKNAEINFQQKAPVEIKIQARAPVLTQVDTTPLSELKIDEDYRITKQQKRQIARGKTDQNYIIDLHGYTLDEGYEVLRKTILYCEEKSYKNLIVITGKGKMHSMFQSWLNSAEIRSYVKYFSNASKKGDGAFYLMLY